MDEQISWDESLIKKYSSSNHFKLLNQLRTEVIKYPLNKKKNISTNITKENNDENRNKRILSSPKDLIKSNLSNYKKEINSDSTISFNNSKNFSIYNSIDSQKEKEEVNKVSFNKTNEESTSISFKERLNKIDMK